MAYRVAQILASESIATAGTKTIEINDTMPISRLTIRVKGTNSSSTPTAHPAKMVTKIELIDGSDVLYSLSGVKAAGMNFIEEKQLPFSIVEYENNIECCQTYHLNFGRYLMDKEYALDPKRFSNLQLKITHNKALGGSAPDAGTLAVFAHIFDKGGVTPKGFMMTKEQREYTLSASAREVTELARDYPYRFIVIQTYVTEVAFNTNISNIKLTVNNDERLLVNDITASELLKVMGWHDKVEEDFAGLGTGSAVDHFVASTYENYAVAIGRSASQTTLIVSQPAGPRIEVTNDSSESFQAHANGYAPFGCMNIATGDEMDPTDWIDPRQMRSFQLDIKAGSSASGNVAILSQQARTY